MSFLHESTLRPAPPSRAAISPSDLALYLLLTLLVWGLFAIDRGLWQDDALFLGQASDALNGSGTLLSYNGLPTRILGRWVFVLALASGKPLIFLQCLYGLIWFLTGWFAAFLLIELIDDVAIAFLAGCLTLTATSDYLTDSLVAVGYLVSMSLCLGALVFALRYIHQGRARLVWSSSLCLAASLWMSDIGLVPACLFVAVVVIAFDRRSSWQARFLGAWALALVPYLLVLIIGLSSSRYGQEVVLDLSLWQRLYRGLTHFLYNFAPWRWAFDRPQWFPEPARALPLWLYAAAAVSGMTAFMCCAWRHSPSERNFTYSGRPKLRGLLAVLFSISAFGTNTAYASLKVSDAFYRTHLGSRVWTALALALAVSLICEVLAIRLGVSPRKAWMAAVLATSGFVGLGIWGGIERQDFYLGSWRLHRRELRSLKESAPEVLPEANVVLWQPLHTNYLATEAEYLGLAWMRLLHGTWPAGRLWLRSPKRGTECVAEAGGIRCQRETCLDPNLCQPLLPWESLVILVYHAQLGRYQLAREVPAELAAGRTIASAQYAPGRLIRDVPWSRPVVGLLGGDRLLGRWLPEYDSRATRDVPPPARVELEFDGDAVDGSGWEQPQKGRSSQWMIAPVATLGFPIAGGRDLCLAVVISHYLAPDIPASLRVTANGELVAITRSSDGARTLFTGVVPARVVSLEPSGIEFAFRVDRPVSPSSLGLGADARPLGLLFDRLTLSPCP